MTTQTVRTLSQDQVKELMDSAIEDLKSPRVKGEIRSVCEAFIYVSGSFLATNSMLKFVLDNQIIVWEQNGMTSGPVFCARWPDGYGAREWFPTRERAIQNAMDRLK